MKRSLISLVLAGFISGEIIAQDTQQQDSSYWDLGWIGIFTFSQSSFTNWQAGGDNTVALSTIQNAHAKYNKGRISWNQHLEFSYGFTNQKSQGFRKTDDKILFGIDVGYRFIQDKPEWLWTTTVSFRTQVSDGFNYPNDSMNISGFMAPGYLLVDMGIEYKKGDHFKVVYSPIAVKTTFVLDDTLSANGAFGVEPGQKVRSQFGTSLRASFDKEILENVNFSSNVILFTGYQNNFGNIDVFWSNLFTLKINNFLASTLVLDLIYDDDIKIKKFDDDGNLTGEGPGLQFKEVFGLGLTIKL